MCALIISFSSIFIPETVQAYQTTSPSGLWSGTLGINASASKDTPSGLRITTSVANSTNGLQIAGLNQLLGANGALSSIFSPALSTATATLDMTTPVLGCLTATCSKGQVKVSFSRPVTNPKIHLNGLGTTLLGAGAYTRLTLATPNVNLTAGAGSNIQIGSGNRIEVKNIANVTSNCGADGSSNGALCGSVTAAGTVSELTFNVDYVRQNTILDLLDSWSMTVSVDEDFGDAPGSYDGSSAASHVISDLKIGSAMSIDNPTVLNGDSPITPSPRAGVGALLDADDSGIGFTGLLTNNIGGNYTINVPVTGVTAAAKLCGWIDFNKNGTFDVSERACQSVAANATTAPLTWTIPAGVTTGDTYARLRLSYDLANVESALGRLDSGEVEDTLVSILTAATPVLKKVGSVDVDAGATVTTQSKRPVFSGTAQANATIQIKRASVTICTTVALNDGTWTCTPSEDQSDGLLSITAHDVTSALSAIISAGINVRIDTTAPNAPVITKNDGQNPSSSQAYITSNTTPLFEGTAEANSTLNLYDGATNICTATVNGSGAWSCDPSVALSDGSHDITTKATDSAGNQSSASNVAKVRIDTSTPEAPLISNPTQNQQVGAKRPVFNGTGEAGSQVTVKEGSTTRCQATVNGGGSWSCQSNADLSDGNHTVTALQTDEAGNESGSSAPRIFTVDSVAPSTNLSSPSADAQLSTKRPTFNGTSDEIGSTVTVKEGSATICTATVQPDNSWTCQASSDLADGEHSFSVAATDAAGNTDQTPATVTVTIDTAVPAAPAIESPDTDESLSDNTPVIRGTGEPGAQVRVTISVDGAPVSCAEGATVDVDEDGDWTCTLASPLTDSPHIISAVQTDAAGNVSAASDDVRVIIDTQNPTITFNDPVSETATREDTIKISASDTVGIATLAWGYNNSATCNGAVTYNNSIESGDSFTITTEAQNGNYVCVKAADAAGNTVYKASGPIVVDRTAPSISFTDDIEEGPVQTDTQKVSVSDPHFNPPAHWGYSNDATCDQNDTYDNDLINNGAFTHYDNTNNGKYICVQASDIAGNVAYKTSAHQLNVSGIPPQAPIITNPANGTFSADNTPTFEGTVVPSADSDLTIEVEADSGESCQTIIPSSGASELVEWSCTFVSALSEGLHTMSVTATDDAPNTTQGGSISIKIDTIAPTIDVIDSVSSTPVRSDHAAAVISDVNPDASEYRYGFSANATCDGSDTFSDIYVSGMAIDFTDTSHNSSYLCFKAVDEAGNITYVSAGGPISIDVAAPAAPELTSPEADDLLATSQPEFTGTGEAGAIVFVKEGDLVICETTVNGQGVWSCTPPSPIADGEHTIFVIQRDSAGNDSDESDTINIVIDATAPSSPSLNQIDSTSTSATVFTNQLKPEFAGTGEAGTTVFVRESGSTICQATVNNEGNWTCTPSVNLSTGEHQFTVFQRDAANNNSPQSSVAQVVIDQSVPGLTVSAPSSGAILAAKTPVLRGLTEDHARIVVRQGDTTLCEAVADDEGAWSCAPAEDMLDGSHTVSVRATDLAGNQSEVEEVTFRIDSTIPVPPVVAVPAEGTNTNDPILTLSGTGEPGATSLIVRENGEIVCETTVSQQGTWSCTLDEALGEGVHSFTAVQTDAAGNTSLSGDARTITVDTTLPEAEVTTPADGGFMNDATPTISGTGEPGDSIVITEEGETRCTTTVAEDGTWSCTITVSVTDGEHTYDIEATDAAGNAIETPLSLTFTVDTATPEAPTLAVIDEMTNDATPTLSGTGEVGATVRVYESGNSSIVLCEAIVDSSGDWSCTSSELEDGEHTLVAKQTDRAGNQSANSNSVSFDLGTSIPARPAVNNPEQFTYVNDATPTISGTGQPDSTLHIEGEAECTATVNSSGAWSCQLSPSLPEGSYVLNVWQGDAFGNRSNVRPLSIIVDRTPPATPTVSSPTNGQTLTSNYPTVAGTAEPNAVITSSTPAGQQCETSANLQGDYTCHFSDAVPNGEWPLTTLATDQASNNSGEVNTEVNVVADLDNDGTNNNEDDDDDGDGVPDEAEDGGPNDGDANDDNSQDSLQPDTATVQVDDGKYHTLVAEGCADITSFKHEEEADLSKKDVYETYPEGLWSFELECGSPGDTASVTVIMDKQYNTNKWTMRKFSEARQLFFDMANGSYNFDTQTIAGSARTTIAWSLQDGSNLDDDGDANGTIIDPVGPSVPAGLAEQGGDGIDNGVNGEDDLAETGQALFEPLLYALLLILLSSTALGVLRPKRYSS